MDWTISGMIDPDASVRYNSSVLHSIYQLHEFTHPVSCDEKREGGLIQKLVHCINLVVIVDITITPK